MSNDVPKTPHESLAATWKRLWSPKSSGAAKFYGVGTRLKFDRGNVESPLVYLYKGKLEEIPDASVIETGLPVAASGSKAEDLPYWPSYRGASSAQRSKYLEWILNGRSDPDVPLGYVFIYFYGLERRVLVDGLDHAAVSAELLRLLQIYGKSRSFARYATGLLWAAIWLGITKSTFPDELVDKAARNTIVWTEETVGLWLACLVERRVNVDASIAYRIAANDKRSPRGIVVYRHADLHLEAFRKRFENAFPQGMELKQSKRDRRLEYFPASATLGRLHDSGGPLANERLPNVLGIPSQFQPLVEIWSSCLDDLRAYDRAHRRSGGEDNTVEMFESLPEDLRPGDHPHFDAWYAVMQKCVTEDGWTIVSIGDLAQLESISERKKLTKAQSQQLATTATHMGLALEPDPRITGQSYSWEDVVSIFPATEELSDDVASYHAAAVLLELGLAIAASDGHIDEVELGRLSTHLESQFDLSSHDSLRLEHLRYLLARRPPQEFSAAKTLQKKLTVPRRLIVGEFLVGVAAADGEIAPQEVAALGKAYRALGLEESDLERLLKTVGSASSSSASTNASGFQLDLDRINAIMAETAKVTEFLREALRDDCEDAIPSRSSSELTLQEITPLLSPPASVAPSNTTSAVESRFRGLPPRYLTFAVVAVERQNWLRTELESLAQRHGLMLGAAMEAINEWSFDTLSDALFVDSDEEIYIQLQLMP
jgi:tellurite resistance protein